MEAGQVPQKQMHQQADPDLPLHGIGIVAQEVRQLERLFDFLEKHLDLPASPIEFRHRPRTPLQIVGQKDEFPFLAIYFDHRPDLTEGARIDFVRSRSAEFHELVVQNAHVTGYLQPFLDINLSIVLGSGYPEDAPLGQVIQVLEVQISLVKQNDFALFQPRANGPGLFAIMILGRVDDRAGGEEALQVQPHMNLGRRLSSAVFGPGHAVGDELDSRRIDGMDGLAKAPQVTIPEFPLGEAGGLLHQVIHHFPVKVFRHLTGPDLVGVAEVVPAWGHCASDRRQRIPVHLQAVTDIIQADGVGDLSVQQGHDVTPRRVSPTLLVDAMCLRDPLDHVPRN